MILKYGGVLTHAGRKQVELRRWSLTIIRISQRRWSNRFRTLNNITSRTLLNQNRINIGRNRKPRRRTRRRRRRRDRQLRSTRKRSHGERSSDGRIHLSDFFDTFVDINNVLHR
ncbi:hypothetical protein Bca4012_006891 [Brassica carinata]